MNHYAHVKFKYSHTHSIGYNFYLHYIFRRHHCFWHSVVSCVYYNFLFNFYVCFFRLPPAFLLVDCPFVFSSSLNSRSVREKKISSILQPIYKKHVQLFRAVHILIDLKRKIDFKWRDTQTHVERSHTNVLGPVIQCDLFFFVVQSILACFNCVSLTRSRFPDINKIIIFIVVNTFILPDIFYFFQ